jgi:uncharacterized protein with PQ loop repeat
MHAIFHRLFNNGRHKHFIDYLAEVNSGISAIALFPQLFALWGGQTSQGLSPLSFFLIAFNSVIWFIYGIHRKSPPLIISSSFNTLVSIGILGMIYIRY